MGSERLFVVSCFGVLLVVVNKVLMLWVFHVHHGFFPYACRPPATRSFTMFKLPARDEVDSPSGFDFGQHHGCKG